MNINTLREEFIRLMTQDSETTDARRREFNQAIFAPESEGGYAIWNGMELYMVLDKFDKAVKNIKRGGG